MRLPTYRSVVLACAACLVVATPALPAYGANRAPRIVSATMIDRDRDDRADAVQLRYSEPIWHARDTDGTYPFTVGTYRIRSVGASRGARVLTIVLREKARKDIGSRPPVRYAGTRSKPVLDRGRKQAIGQTFRRTVALDKDGDGYTATDCAPLARTVHPGAPDSPDLGFLDSNCDRIDGDSARAIFVSPAGLDANPGSMGAPLKTLAEAVRRAATTPLDEDVYLATGEHTLTQTLRLHAGSGIYGGYSAGTWARSATPSTVLGPQSAMLAEGATDITLQLLDVRSADGEVGPVSSTVLTVRERSGVRLERVTLRAGAGAPGRHGTQGANGAPGQPGNPGTNGLCDAGNGRVGGPQVGTGSQAGGKGGDGGVEGANAGQPGARGAQGGFGGGAGGAGGPGGDPGRAGIAGGRGLDGDRGVDGGSINGVWTSSYWFVLAGQNGTPGTAGYGGGGGGGGGGQGGAFVDDGGGNGGGSGGQGGFPGQGATPGSGGGASIAAYVADSTLTLVRSSLIAADGGRGGDGAAGGFGGNGGAGGVGASNCTSEIGAGGYGGPGGDGGDGGASGAGQGGPSVAVVSYSATVDKDTATTLTHGAAGAGGFSPGADPASDGAAGVAAPLYTVPVT